MRTAFALLLLLLTGYATWFALGPEGRAETWAVIRRHIFPISAIMAVVLFMLVAAFSSTAIKVL